MAYCVLGQLIIQAIWLGQQVKQYVSEICEYIGGSVHVWYEPQHKQIYTTIS
jgi:hypothetical protein